jgi:hypothetical protein
MTPILHFTFSVIAVALCHIDMLLIIINPGLFSIINYISSTRKPLFFNIYRCSFIRIIPIGIIIVLLTSMSVLGITFVIINTIFIFVCLPVCLSVCLTVIVLFSLTLIFFRDLYESFFLIKKNNKIKIIKRHRYTCTIFVNFFILHIILQKFNLYRHYFFLIVFIFIDTVFYR